MNQGKDEQGPPPWEVDVDVYVYAESHDPPFRIDSYLQEHDDGDLVFRNRGRHGFFVNFHLHDESGEGYRWPKQPNVEKALRSQKGEGCPPTSCGQWKEFETRRVVMPDRMTLVVRNRNETKTKFGYTLRVTKDDGATFRDLDPGGDNLNGNFSRFIEPGGNQ